MERASFVISPALLKSSLSRAIPASLYLQHSFQKKKHSYAPALSSSSKNLYEMLGVEHNSTENEIGSAYRKLAKEHHPDLNQTSDEYFQALTHAYETLRDPDARRKYDLEMALCGDVFSRQRTKDTPHVPVTTENIDIHHTVSATLEDLYNGKVKKFQVGRFSACTACESDEVTTCEHCHGKGYTRHKAAMLRKLQTLCPHCRGLGHSLHCPSSVSAKTEQCEKCHGKKRVLGQAIFQVQISPGMAHGQQIVYAEQGDQPTSAPNKKRGNVVFTIAEQKHALFTRRGNDLLMHHTLSVSEAMSGQFRFSLVHLDGRVLNVVRRPHLTTQSSPSSLKQTWIECIRNAGMPLYAQSPHTASSSSSPVKTKKFGHLFVQFHVDQSKTSPHSSPLLSSLVPSSLFSHVHTSKTSGSHVEDETVVVLSELDHVEQECSE